MDSRRRGRGRRSHTSQTTARILSLGSTPGRYRCRVQIEDMQNNNINTRHVS